MKGIQIKKYLYSTRFYCMDFLSSALINIKPNGFLSHSFFFLTLTSHFKLGFFFACKSYKISSTIIPCVHILFCELPFVAVSSRWFHLVACRNDRAPEAGTREKVRPDWPPTIQKSIFICKTITFTFIQCSLVRSQFPFFCISLIFFPFCSPTRVFHVCVCVYGCAIGCLTLEWTFIQFAKQPQAAQ